MRVVELCEWLQRGGLVSAGQLSDKASSMAPGELLPPSLRSMVQSDIDQLPSAPAMVLRCASVLGKQFETSTLLGMLDVAVASNEQMLQERLQALQSAHLMERVVTFERTPRNNAACVWQVTTQPSTYVCTTG